MKRNILYWAHMINVHQMMVRLFGEDKVGYIDVPSWMEAEEDERV